MGKRFGRNQKRKFREQLSQKDLEVALVNKARQQDEHIINHCKEIFRVIKRVCPDSVALEECRYVGENHWFYERRNMTIDYMAFGSDCIPETYELTRLSLSQLEVDLQESDFDRLVTVMVKIQNINGDGPKAYYRGTMESFQHYPEFVEREISRQLTDLLVENLKQA